MQHCFDHTTTTTKKSVKTRRTRNIRVPDPGHPTTTTQKSL